MDLLRIIIAILLPPLGVFLQVGIGKQFWINILLTILGYIPGIVHAVWVIAKYQSCQPSAHFFLADGSGYAATRFRRRGGVRRSSTGRQPLVRGRRGRRP